MNWGRLFLEVLAAAVGTIGFSVLFQVNPRHHFFCGLVGGIGWLVYRSIVMGGGSEVLATFVATVVLAACCRWFSTLRRTPTIVFLICGVFTLVPGAAIYYMAYYLFLDDGAQVAYYGAATLKLAGAIALGIVVTYSLPAWIFGWRRDVEEPTAESDETN